MEKKTVYLLCGLLCDAEVWTEQAAALSAQHDVRIVSFQGFDTLGAMAEHVLAKAPARFALAGHSMGGRVALEVYRRAAARVERLALLDTGYEPASPGEEARRYALVNKAEAEGIDAVARLWGEPMVAPCNRARVLDRVCAMVGRMSPEIYAKQTRALLSRPDASDVLGTITCPTLVLCGAQDEWSPPQRHERMQALIPGSWMAVIDDCGHMCTMERPAQVLDALQAWLAA